MPKPFKDIALACLPSPRRGFVLSLAPLALGFAALVVLIAAAAWYFLANRAALAAFRLFRIASPQCAAAKTRRCQRRQDEASWLFIDRPPPY
jgi:hypothetical protein